MSMAIIREFVLLQLIQGTYFCPLDQIYQNVTDSCCYPVFNCRPGNGVVFCTINGTSDICTPCPEGEIQPQLVSSLDGIDATCFRDETQNDCTSAEFLPARKRQGCGVHCLCNNDNCYYLDDPCRCRLKNPSSCEVNMTMDKRTGECVKCPKYTFKNNTGCGLCYYNEMEWFDHQKEISTMFTPLTSIGVTEDSKHNNSSGMMAHLAALIATGLAATFGVLLILACIYRNRLKRKWLLLYRQCQERSADDDPVSLQGLTHTMVNPEIKMEFKESETPVMEVRPVVQNCSGSQNAESEEPLLDNKPCRRDETQRDETYVKEVVGSQTGNVDEERHSMTTENQMTEHVQDVNDHGINENANILLEESTRQREIEEENQDKEVVPLIAQYKI